MGKTVKQWKTDGEEDQKIQSLISKGKINKYTKPSTLQKDFPDVFGSFSPQVLRNHLNAAKRFNGLYLDPEDEGEASFECDKNECDKNVAETPRSSSIDVNALLTGDKTMHYNYPVTVKQFTCPETESEKVLMVASLPGGAEGGRVELHDDGIGVSIKNSWPQVMYNVNDLFKKQLRTGVFHGYHPMLLCFKSGLEQIRKKIDVAPDAMIKVVLPIRVQTAINSWNKWGVKREDGSQVILAVFSGYVKDYVKKVSDETVQFE